MLAKLTNFSRHRLMCTKRPASECCSIFQDQGCHYLNVAQVEDCKTAGDPKTCLSDVEPLYLVGVPLDHVKPTLYFWDPTEKQDQYL